MYTVKEGNMYGACTSLKFYIIFFTFIFLPSYLLDVLC